MVAYGYEPGFYLFQNSWGSGYGNEGRNSKAPSDIKDKPDPEAAPVRAFITRWAPIFGESPLFKHAVAAYRAAWYDDMNAQEPMPALEDLLANEKPPRIGVIQHERLSMLVEHMTEDVEERKVLLADLIKREEAQAQ